MLSVLFAYLEPMLFAIATKVFKRKKTKTVASHTINYGHIVENDETIDEVMVRYACTLRPLRVRMWWRLTLMVVSLSTMKFQLLIRSGAYGRPGEFTKRAFLNGRVDFDPGRSYHGFDSC